MSQNTNTDIITIDVPHVEVWGTREEVAALGKRIKAMLPGGEKLTPEQAMAMAQYAVITDANPFRGDFYGMVDRRGNFTFVEGYKLLVRWAKRICGYTERYVPLSAAEKRQMGLRDEDIAYRCHILRDDQKDTLREFIQMGATFAEAYDIVTTQAVGVVTREDRVTRDGKPIDPPKGWTWDQVAQKRALKNALNLSHGAPSPRELAAESWKVGDTETRPEDWQDAPPEIARDPELAARYAALQAHTRQVLAENDRRSPEERAEQFQKNVSLLRGDDGIETDFIEEDRDRFYRQVRQGIPYFTTNADIDLALSDMKLRYDPENEEFLFDQLARYAGYVADMSNHG
ncbi:MAG: hypothetical protein D6784_14590 [Chloroflexi bacterium]|nr:MAG: hypothetical protein D6784_14590 [Chloroflexota bacterium]